MGPVEDAPVEHQGLTAAVLLGGRPEEADGDAELVGLCGQGQGGPDCSAGDDVVTAGVPDLGKGVVLADDADHELTGAETGPKRRGQLPDTAFHLQPRLGQQISDGRGRETLLEPELGSRVNGVAKGNGPWGDLIDHGGELFVPVHRLPQDRDVATDHSEETPATWTLKHIRPVWVLPRFAAGRVAILWARPRGMTTTLDVEPV